MKNLNYQTGKLGEQMAKDYLVKKGYQIIKSNFRTRFGEIDLVANKDKRLVFTEVKLKIGDDFGTPEEMINKNKVGRIQKMAEYFLQINPGIAAEYSSYQIDAICITLNLDGTISRLNHWENLNIL